MKVKIGIYATANLKYAKPGNTASIEVQKIWDFDKTEVGEIKIDDYDGVRQLLAIHEFEVPAEQFYAMKVDEFVPQAFAEQAVKLRADFQKAITENQAALQSFLALPLEA